MKTLRLIWMGWMFQFKQMRRSSFDSFLAILWPLFFATVAFFMFRQGGDPDALIYASLGAAVMGIWTATSVAAGSALQRERWYGTLEILVAAPAHFSLILLPIGLATATIGLYCMATTLLFGRIAFGIELGIQDPFSFALAVLATLLSIGALGFLIAVAFARYRNAWALGAVSEYPVWLVCGFLVPITLLPGWVEPISWLLAPSWGMSAIRAAADGGSPWAEVGMCFLLGAGYVAVGVLITNRVLRAARTRASLSLT
ncbi:MAG: ABC transporter permease [Gaiellaceae bacterium]